MATVLTRSVGASYSTQLIGDHHTLVADEPQPDSDNLGPTPYELLLSALGACTSMTLLMYARREGWNLDEVQIELTHDRVHARDCEDCEGPDGKIDLIQRRIRLEGELTDQQREKLMEIATRCPVHKTMVAPPEVRDELVRM